MAKFEQFVLNFEENSDDLEPFLSQDPVNLPVRKRRRRGRGTGSFLNRGLGMHVPKRMGFCPVPVRSYWRFRLGRWEQVRAHCRRMPQR